MGLCLHAGAQHKTRKQIEELPLGLPMGNRHVIRPFINDIVLVDHYLGEYGLRVRDEAYGVTFNDNGLPARFFGAMEIESSNTEFALTVGLRGSYDQTLPRGLAVGSRVFVCDNLAFSSDIVMHTRQTTFVENRIPEMLRKAVSQIPQLADKQAGDFNNYKEMRILHKDGDALLMQCLRKEVLTMTQFAKAVEFWDKSEDDSVWGLYNVVTAAIKPNVDKPNMLNAWKRGIGLTDIINERYYG